MPPLLSLWSTSSSTSSMQSPHSSYLLCAKTSNFKGTNQYVWKGGYTCCYNIFDIMVIRLLWYIQHHGYQVANGSLILDRSGWPPWCGLTPPIRAGSRPDIVPQPPPQLTLPSSRRLLLLLLLLLVPPDIVPHHLNSYHLLLPPIHPKSEKKMAENTFQLRKNWQKKCVNRQNSYQGRITTWYCAAAPPQLILPTPTCYITLSNY